MEELTWQENIFHHLHLSIVRGKVNNNWNFMGFFGWKERCQAKTSSCFRWERLQQLSGRGWMAASLLSPLVRRKNAGLFAHLLCLDMFCPRVSVSYLVKCDVMTVSIVSDTCWVFNHRNHLNQLLNINYHRWVSNSRNRDTKFLCW